MSHGERSRTADHVFELRVGGALGFERIAVLSEHHVPFGPDDHAGVSLTGSITAG